MNPDPVVIQNSGVPEVEQDGDDFAEFTPEVAVLAQALRDFGDRIAQAIGDPGSIVGRKRGPSWGVGEDGYSEREETVTRWATRAVLHVLTEQPGGVPVLRPEAVAMEQVEALRRELEDFAEAAFRQGAAVVRGNGLIRAQEYVTETTDAVGRRLDRIEQYIRDGAR